ncbi:hypothetical protein GQ53DRAFT_851020 [Thozetella sp. PMI_491]|nr:hypothetical protein GQ53DRAFT_851020 [Thozetella sp. PMI_491]
MDPVSGGASVLAFIGLALQSATTIYTFLNGISNGSESVVQAAFAVSTLQACLERIQQNPAAIDSVSAQNVSTIQRCSDELGLFAARISKLQVKDTDTILRKTWKRTATVFKEKDLQKMVSIITNHSSTLNLWLSSSNLNTSLDLRDRICTLNQTATTHLQLESDHLSSTSASLLEAAARQKQAAAIEKIHFQALSTAINESSVETARRFDSFESKTNLVLDSLQTLLSSFTIAGDDTHKTLYGLREQARLMQRDCLSSNASIRPFAEDKNQSLPPATDSRVLGDYEVLESIELLSSLSDDGERTACAEDIEDIIRAMERVLAAAQDQSDELEDRRNLNRINGVISSARRIAINKRFACHFNPTQYIVKQSRKRKEYELGTGVLNIATKRQLIATGSGDTERFESRWTFLPHRRSGATMITSAIHQDSRWDGTVLSSIPRLEANRIVPNDSAVFKLILDGQLLQLQQLLQAGKASLRDHDEDGDCLLSA